MKLGSDAVLRFNNGFATILNAGASGIFGGSKQYLHQRCRCFLERCGQFHKQSQVCRASMPGWNVFITDNANDKIKVDKEDLVTHIMSL